MRDLETVRALWRGGTRARAGAATAQEVEIACARSPVQRELPCGSRPPATRRPSGWPASWAPACSPTCMGQRLGGAGPKVALYREAWRRTATRAGAT